MALKSFYLLFTCSESHLPRWKEIACKNIKHYGAQGFQLHSQT